jgi:dolichol-phosphate mannosyltransferase
MIPPSPASLDLSVVIPVYNEIENLDPLLVELRAALGSTRRDAEIVLVDDASSDGSARWILDESRRDSRVRAVLLQRRGGQSAALAAGLSRAQGRVIVTLDADLQNDPADLPRLLEALGGADVVSGIRARRQDGRVRLISSRLANATRRAVLGDTVTDIGCSFKAYRRETLVGLPPFVGVHRFLPALCQFRGARLVEVAVAHRPRRHGASKYGVSNRLWRGLYDLIGVRWLKSRLIAPPPREGDP